MQSAIKKLRFVYKEILFCYWNRECRLIKSWKWNNLILIKKLDTGGKVQLGKPRLLTKHNTSDAFCDRGWAMICSLVLSHTLVLINTDFWKPTNEDCYLGTLPALVVINWESSVEGRNSRRWEVENEHCSLSNKPISWSTDVLTPQLPESLPSTELFKILGNTYQSWWW